MTQDGPPYRDHAGFLWALSYRLTGSAADADDIVQETFARALAHPPPDPTLPWRPWLTRVAVNLGRDLLRRRHRRAYPGPWLPAPVEEPHEPLLVEDPPQARYDLLESVSYAFLLALEALTPPQRAVLLLRDAFDYSVRETAEALDLSEASVKTTHHRARRAMAAYDTSRRHPTEAAGDTLRALQAFTLAVAKGDVAAVEALLAEEVRALTDGGGKVMAARVPVIGRRKVARFYVNLARQLAAGAVWTVRTINALPALVGEFPGARERHPPRMVLRVDVDAIGRIAAVHSVVTPDKLGAIGA